LSDALVEPEETFETFLQSAVNATLSAAAGADRRAEVEVIDVSQGFLLARRTATAAEQKPMSMPKVPNIVLQQVPFSIPGLPRQHHVQVYSMMGQLIKQFRNGANRFHIGNVSPGIYVYVIRFRTEAGKWEINTGRMMIF
jgi:hypothetical protein